MVVGKSQLPYFRGFALDVKTESQFFEVEANYPGQRIHKDVNFRPKVAELNGCRKQLADIPTHTESHTESMLVNRDNVMKTNGSATICSSAFPFSSALQHYKY